MITECKNCSLHEGRFKIVWGEGNPEAEVMFIGEAPGADENIEGRPFVGKAGKILDSLFPLAGLTREEVYITNIVKCRPPANRVPLPEEIKQCREYLNQQIMEIKPKYIVCLGKSAITALTGLDKDMGSFTKKAWNYLGIRVLAVYHPAATLYNRGLRDKLYKQFIELGHLIGKTRAASNGKELPHSDIAPEVDYKFETIQTTEEAVSVLNFLYDSKGDIAFDTETTGLDYRDNHIIGMSFATRIPEEGNIIKAWYLPLRHRSKTLVNIPINDIKYHLSLLFKHKKLILHNAKFDWHMLTNEGLSLNEFEDTMLMMYSFIEDEESYGLKDLGVKYIRVDADRYEKELNKVQRELDLEDDCDATSEYNWGDIPIEQMTDYACNDPYLSLRLFELFGDKANPIVYKKEKELVPVIMRMERNGLAVNINYYAQQAGDLTNKIATVKEEIYQLAGQRFNIDSKEQLGGVLENTFGFVPVELTKKKGQMVVDDVCLMEYYNCPFSRKVLEFRSFSKLLNTYVLPILHKQRQEILKTDIMQHRTNNGRLASSNPNLQNLPKRKKKTLKENPGDMIRKGLVVRNPNNTLMFADYSQIELRIAAMYAEVKEMIDTYKQNGDVHSNTAKKIYRTEEPTELQRYWGKTTNFLSVYGGGPRPIVRILIKEEIDIPPEFKSRTEFAEWLSKSWGNSYPEAKEFRGFVERKGLANGQITNLFGRIRHINKENAWAGFQFLCSSSAADVVKDAMIKVDKYIQENNLKTMMLLQIHDELIFEIPEEELNVIPKIKELMEVKTMEIPLTVDIETSKTNWTEREDYE